MRSKLALLGAVLVALSLVSWSRVSAGPAAPPQPQEEEQVWSGVVSDSICGAKWSAPSEEAAADVKKCVGEKDAKYVLVSEGKVLQLEPQEKFADFAGQAVKVTGVEKDGTITASMVEAAEPAEPEDDN